MPTVSTFLSTISKNVCLNLSMSHLTSKLMHTIQSSVSNITLPPAKNDNQSITAVHRVEKKCLPMCLILFVPIRWSFKPILRLKPIV